MRIVVTGGAGFIGSHVVTALAAAGSEVCVIDNLLTGALANLEGLLLLQNVHLEVCDIRSAEIEAILSRFRPTIVVHLAAQASVVDAARSPSLDADINVGGTINILEAASQAGVEKMVAISSSAIYGDVESAALPISEASPMRPVSPYGISKAATLYYVEWYASCRGVPATIIIPGNVYGPRQRPGSGVTGRFVSAMMAHHAVEIRGYGRQTRDFVHVDDVAEAIVRACALPAAGRVNVATGTETEIGAAPPIDCGDFEAGQCSGLLC